MTYNILRLTSDKLGYLCYRSYCDNNQQLKVTSNALWQETFALTTVNSLFYASS